MIDLEERLQPEGVWIQRILVHGGKHKEKAVIWMHGSSMNEKHCLADSLYLREAGYSVLVLGFYYWKGMSKKMRAIPVEYVERAVVQLSREGLSLCSLYRAEGERFLRIADVLLVAPERDNEWRRHPIHIA